MAVLDTNEIFYTTFEPKTVNRGIIYIDGIPAFTVFKMKKLALQFQLRKFITLTLTSTLQVRESGILPV